LRQWFSSGERNIAIVTGGVSGGLAVRDFDQDGAYEMWRDHHQDIAAALPTVRTARGYHVYARGEADKTMVFIDGEFRYGGAYVLAPPSIHPGGVVYTWTNPLADFVPQVDLVASGLLTDWSACSTEGTEIEGQGNTVGASHSVCAVFSVSTVSTVLPEGVDAVIRRTIPPNVGWREKCLFNLCRELQAIPEYAAADPRELEPIVRMWYELAEPRIGTKEYAVSFAAFIRAWGNVKVPKDQTVVQVAFRRIKNSDRSWIPERFDGEGIRLLIALCRELQSIRGQQPFYLDCRTAGSLLGVTYKTAWTWLETLCVLGALKKVSSGTLKNRKANEYRYLL
jgi:hypothetical protein